MKMPTTWILNLPWLVQLLSLWLRLPVALRGAYLIPVIFIMCLSATAVSVYAALQAAKSNINAADAQAQALRVIATPEIAQPRLPPLSSVALYDLIQHFGSPQINQQRGRYTLNFHTNWRDFADFSNQIALSNLAPDSYRLQWSRLQDVNSDDQHAAFNVQLQLTPGRYVGHSEKALSLAADHTETAQISPPIATVPCPQPAPPQFILQASWPSRGYIQVLINGHSERIEVNQMLENSWQLLRIGSDSLEFRWHNANPACATEIPFTVAI